MSHEQKEHDCTPRLRFPEFDDHTPWSTYLLGDILSFCLTATNSRSDLSETGEYKYIHYGDIHTKFNFILNIEDRRIPFLKKGISVRADIIKNGDIIIADTSEDTEGIGKAVEVCSINSMIKAISGLHTFLLRPKDKIFSSFFSAYLFSSLGIKSQLEKIATGMKVYSLSKKELKLIILPIPSLEEQQKIADCLTSLDDLITAHEQKRDALAQHKKGLMQRLFPAEGETTPRWRFPEFRGAGEWETVRLGNLVSVGMCKRIFAEETNSIGGVPFYKIGTLGGIADSFISYELFDNYKNKYNYPEKGEVLITCSGTIGKIVRYSGEDAYYQDSNIVWIKNNQQGIINDFLFYFFDGFSWDKLNSTTITRIYGDDLRNILLCLPIDKKEQQKIADCLSALDERIAAQEAKIAALREHKKGLMQQLFPR